MGNQWVQFILITRSLSNSPDVWTLESVKMGDFSISLQPLLAGTNPRLGFLKCLKTACSNPSNKRQDDDENATPRSNDSFPGCLKLKLPTEIGYLCQVLCLQAALDLAAKCKGLTCLGSHAGLLPTGFPAAPPAHDTHPSRVLLPTCPWCCSAWTLLCWWACVCWAEGLCSCGKC